MSETFALVVEGVETFRDFRNINPAIQRAAQQAINRELATTRTDSAKRMASQVKFPGSFLSPAQGRFSVTRYAKPGDLEGAITARGRATGLARFSTTTSINGARKAGGVQVEVKPGNAVFMRKAFLIRLKSGSGTTDTKNNLGLAIRLLPGRRLNKNVASKQIFPNVYLLYGPSVYQVFETIKAEVVPASADRLVDEFDRILALELSN